MDPITRAMSQLASDAEAFWRAHPSQLLPLLAAEDQREDVVQALRLYEARPENRRPFVVFRAPFEEATAYFSGLAEQIGADHERVREGAAKEGVSLPSFAGDYATAPSSALTSAALAMEQAARLLGSRFDGLVIALVPHHVTDEAGWRESVRALAATRRAARVRLAILAPPHGPLAAILGNEGARFHVDPGSVWAFLKQLSPEASARAAAAEPGAKLRALLLGATEALGAGKPVEAAALYREARTVCQAARLVEQEAAVLMALGGACLAAHAPDLAAESYRQAAVLAEQAEAWPLACQARLGMGGAYLLREEYAAATVAYRAAAAAAERARIVPLHVEALRMAGTCLSRLGLEDEAILAWNTAAEARAA